MTSIASDRPAALRKFKRQLVLLVVSGLAMAVLAIAYLSMSGPLTGTLVVTATVGVFVSVVLGGGLMAAGFFSAESGVDDQVAASTTIDSQSISTKIEYTRHPVVKEVR